MIIESLLGSGHFVLLASVILIVAILFMRSGSRFGTPALLLFLVIGMLFGSDGLGIQFSSVKIAQFIGMLALSVILFSGGMETKFSDIRPVIGEGLVLATAGVLFTALLTGAFIYFMAAAFGLRFSFAESLLLAAVMSSTDSASVFSILRSKRMGLRENLRPLLELESGSNDPMAYILTIILIEAIGAGEINVWRSVVTFVVQMSLGAIMGYGLGRIAVITLNRINLDNKSLYSVLLLAVVYFIFSVTDLVGGNGYLAVYMAGLVVGNYKVVYQKSLTTFFDGYTWLFQIVMFITLGLLVNPHEMLDVVWIGLSVGVFMILFARPLSVFLCLAPFRKLSRRGILYVAWVGLRGAAPIIFATYPLAAGIEHSGMIFNTVFFITIVSLIVQGTTVSHMAGTLGLSTEMAGDSFGIDMPDEISASLTEEEVGEAWLRRGSRLKDMPLAPQTLVMMIRRGDDYIVPNGDTELMAGDKLLCITGGKDELPRDYALPERRGRRRVAGALRRLKAGRGYRAAAREIVPDERAAEPGDSAYEEDLYEDPRFEEDLMDDEPMYMNRKTE